MAYQRANGHAFSARQIRHQQDIQKVFSEGELGEKSNVQKMHVPNSDKPVVFYNLDVIISVGYRVKSQRGVQFRIWASGILNRQRQIGRWD